MPSSVSIDLTQRKVQPFPSQEMESHTSTPSPAIHPRCLIGQRTTSNPYLSSQRTEDCEIARGQRIRKFLASRRESPPYYLTRANYLRGGEYGFAVAN